MHAYDLLFQACTFLFAAQQHVERASVPTSLIPTSTRFSVPLYPRRKLIKVSWSTGTTGGTCTLRVYVYRITWCTGGYWHGNCVDSSQALVPTGNCHSPPPAPPLPFLGGSCRVIGWLLRTWWTQPNIQGVVAGPTCDTAPPGTLDTYFSVWRGNGMIRRSKEMG